MNSPTLHAPYAADVSYADSARVSPVRPVLPGWWIAAALAASVAVQLLLLWRARLSIDPSAASCRPFYAAGALLVGLRIGLRRPSSRLQRIGRDAAGYFGAFALIVLIGATVCYPIAALSHGYADGWLARSDTMMGFDWTSWYRVVAAHPVLQAAGRMAYESIFVSPVLIIAHAAIDGRADRAHAFILSFWLAATITLTLYWLMPAVGPFAYLAPTPARYLPISELWQPQLIPALRAHALHVIDLGQLRGLVSAPSFHAAAAILFAAGAWPIARLRWPLLAVNAAMLLATPVEGTHYLTDIVMGVAIALLSLAIVRRIETARR